MACAPSEDSGQPGHPPSLISLCCPHVESLGPYLPIERTTKTLIRLGRHPSWSESSLGAHATLLVLSWGGSNSSTSVSLFTLFCLFRRPPAVTVVWKYGRSQTVLLARVGMCCLNAATSGNAPPNGFFLCSKTDCRMLYLSVILVDLFYLLLQVTFPIQKWPYFSQFCVYFPKYNEKSIYLFPNVKAQVASQNRR